MKMLKPEMDIVRFGAEDVIATSGAAMFTHTVRTGAGDILEMSEVETVEQVLALSDSGGLFLTTNEGHEVLHAYFHGDIEGYGDYYSSFVKTAKGNLEYNGTAPTDPMSDGKGWYYSENGSDWIFCGSN